MRVADVVNFGGYWWVLVGTGGYWWGCRKLLLTVVNHGRQHHVEHEVISDVHVPHDRKR